MEERYEAINGRDVGNGFDAVAIRKGGSIIVTVTDLEMKEEWEPMVFDADFFESVKDAAIKVARCPSQYA